MNNFSKKEIILLFGFVLLLLITWPKQGTAGTTYTQDCQTAGSCSCFGGTGASCTTNAQCLNNLCSYSCPPATGAIGTSSLTSNNCSQGTSNNCDCWEIMGYCFGGKTCSCTISGTCNYTCKTGWQDANNNPADGCEAPTVAFDFSISRIPISASVVQDGTTSTSVTATLLAGASQTVTFSASSTEPTIFLTWIGITCNPTCSRTLVIDTLTTTPPGLYTINITGTGGGITKTTTFALTVTAAPAAFDFSISRIPISASVVQDGSTSTSVTATLLAGASQTVTFSASSTEPTIFLAWIGITCNPTCNRTLVIDTLTTTPPGLYTITITGTGGGLTRTTTFALTVTSAPVCVRAIPEVTFNPPSQTGNPGEEKSYTIEIKNNDTLGCDKAAFVVAIESCPSNWSCELNHLLVVPGVPPQTTDSSTILTVKSPSTAGPGKYTISIKVVHSKAGPGYETIASAEYIISYCQELLNRTGAASGRKCFQPGYDPIADIDKDKDVDIVDTAAVAQHLGLGDEAWCETKWKDTTDPCNYCGDLQQRITNAMSRKCFDAKYDPIADINKDKKVDIIDQAKLVTDCKFTAPGVGDEVCCKEKWSSVDPCPYCQELLNRIGAASGAECFQPRYNPIADVNKDGKVDIRDAGTVAKCEMNDICCKGLWDPTDKCSHCQVLLEKIDASFGKECFQPGYDPLADVNKGGIINQTDKDAVNNCGGDKACCQGLWSSEDICSLPYVRGWIKNPLKAKSLAEFVDNLINLIFYLGLAIVPISALIAGIYLLVSGGDPEKVRRAKTILLYTAIGLAIVFMAKGIIELIKRVVGG